ncbi:MAG: fibronectin type III domain-containing protein [Clostridiales bacterium]|nr:fibronectin type III domain-containing protein [Clostridiales bacterium]
MYDVKPLRGSQKLPDHIMLSISDDAKTTMTVTWRTCTEIGSGYVLFHEEGSDKVFRADAVFEEFKSDIDVSNIFWAKLTGLKPGTKYYYSVGDDKYRSLKFYFTTEPDELSSFKFICVSDQQKNDPFNLPDYSYFNKFIRSVLKENPDVRFILTGGDNTDCGQHEVQWNGAFSGFVGISEYLPVMMALGNHDNRGFRDYEHGTGRYYSEPAEFFGKQFKGSYADNGPDGWKTENYTFDYGNTHFSVIGINGPEDVNEWLIDDLKKCEKKWKLGVYHFPICYSGVDCQNYDAYPVMREGFEMFDLIFSGHEHNFSRSFPLKNEELFDKPSQGTVHYMLGNSNQNPPGSGTMAKVWHAAYYPHEEKRAMVAIVEIDGGKITLTSVLDDGRTVDKCIIDKDADTILPYAVSPVFRRTKMMFKGMDLGLCQMNTYPENRDGVWYIPISLLISFIGGELEKTKGRLYVSAYGHSAEFFEDSELAITDRGEMKLDNKVYRGERGQLYVPVDAVKAFDMRWAYSARNNFISIETESEDKPIWPQP